MTAVIASPSVWRAIVASVVCVMPATVSAQSSRCHATAGAGVAVGLANAVAVTAVPDGEGWAVVVRTHTDARRGATDRAMLVRVDHDGTAGAPMELATWRARHGGAITAAAHDGVVSIAWETAAGIDGVSSADPHVRAWYRPRRPVAHPPFVRSTGDVLVLVHRATGSVRIEALTEVHRDDVRAQLPGNSLVVDVASRSDGAWFGIARTPGGRYVVVTFDRDGHLAWTGNGPAGCDHGRCPAVSLVGAGSRAVAWWLSAPTRDGLSVPGARELDEHGHAQGPRSAFVPMAHPVFSTSPEGRALALQLGRPTVVRGAARPFVLDDGTVPDVAAMSVVRDGATHVFTVRTDGTVHHDVITCTAASPR